MDKTYKIVLRVVKLVELSLEANDQLEAEERALAWEESKQLLLGEKGLKISVVSSKETYPIVNILPEEIEEEIEFRDVELLPPAGQEEISELRDLTAFMIPEGLTDSQGDAYTNIISFLNNKKSKYFRLAGYAGTGKTYLVAKILDWVKVNKKKWLVTLASPTNKAARNLQSICEAEGISVETKTVARLMGLQPEINDLGEQIFRNKSGSTIGSYDLVFIDEFSMLDQKTVEEIFRQCDVSGVKVIFIGDEAQLPPVNEDISLVSTHPLITESASLVEVVRYTGEIATVAEAIRSNPRWNRQDYPFKSSLDETVIKLTADEWVERVMDFFREDLSQTRIIAWRNRTVDEYNIHVRKWLYGEDVEDYIVGDILIAKSPVFRKIGENNEKVIIFNNSDEFQVEGEKTLKKKEYMGKTWEYWEVPVGGSYPLMILTPEYEEQRQEMLGKIKQKALTVTGKSRRTIWTTQYYPLIETFDCISYCYAITCHKAQGSSIPYVFLDVMDMRGCSDRQKILYTGLTRAVHAVYVY